MVYLTKFHLICQYSLVFLEFAIVIGLFTFGLIEGLYSIRQSILSLVVFFAIGFVFLLLTAAQQKANKTAILN